SPSLFIYAVVFFLLGYLLYATLAAMLGSLVSRVEDVQQLILPMTFLIMIAFFIAMFGLNMPESKLVVISSYIPFFSPMLMFLRVGMVDVPVWEVALSIGILVASIIVLAILGAKVYKGGVLMYGRTSSLKDLKKAMALSYKEQGFLKESIFTCEGDSFILALFVSVGTGNASKCSPQRRHLQLLVHLKKLLLLILIS